MIERIKPIICLEEGIVALLLKVDRQILPKVVGARYGKADIDSVGADAAPDLHWAGGSAPAGVKRS